jgi:hypothetical protein
MDLSISIFSYFFSVASVPSHESFSVKVCKSCGLWYLTNLPFALAPSAAH